MTKNDLLTELSTIFRDVLDIDDLVLTPETSARDVEEWDSLAHIRLIVATEQKYNLKFKVAEIAELKNVGEFADLILTKLQSSST